MTASTHKQFSICTAFIVAIILYANGFSQIDYFLSIPILLLVSKYGALFPDIDHVWQNVKEKTTVNKILNKLIHLTGGRHRSWQTHSIDIALVSLGLGIVVPNMLYINNMITLINKEVMMMILIGFSSGWLSHLFSDMLTSKGVRVICFCKLKIALVPKSIGNLKFKTGDVWERFVYKFMRVANTILGIASVIAPFIISGSYHDLILKLFNMG